MAKKTTKKVAKSTPTSADVSPQTEPVAAVAENPPSEEKAHTSGEPQPQKEASSVTPEQQREIDRVLKQNEQQTKQAIEAILGGQAMAGIGTSPGNADERQDRVQADSLPGTKRRDLTYVPEHVYDDRDGWGRKKKVLDYNNYRYYLCPQEKFDTATLAGWKFCQYDGGSRSGLLNEGWQGTGDSVFIRDIRGYCRRGDVYLMYTEVARYNQFKAEDREAVERASLAPVGDFANVAYGKGIRAMAQVNGEDIL